VMVGDTTFDIEMARAAGARAIGVTWGYHRPEALVQAGAEAMIEHFDELEAAIDRIWAASSEPALPLPALAGRGLG
jgi:phosphoglycolate phosphatase